MTQPSILDTQMCDVTFISHEDQLSPAWLSEVLQAPVQALSFKRIGDGMIGKNLRIEVTYSEPQADAPTSLVVKFPSDELVSRKTGLMGRLYEREVKFYRQIAPHVAAVVPKTLVADISADHQDFCLLMEDVAPCSYGNQLVGCSWQEAQSAMDAAAQLHAPFWDSAEIQQHEWLSASGVMSKAVPLLIEKIPLFLDIYREKLSTQHLDLIARFANLAQSYYSLHQAPFTITHGDFRLDNMMFQASGGKRNICVVDWQTVLIRPGMTDVSFFIGCGLLPDARRLHERDLVTRYHQRLLAQGVTHYDWEACWRDYRLYAPQGLVQAILAVTATARTERGDKLFQVMTERHCEQMLDLSTLDLVEELSAAARV